MSYGVINEPPSIGDAFEHGDDGAILTQAAFLLALGVQLRSDRARLEEVLPPDDVARLGVPPLPPEPGRIDSQRIKTFLARRFLTSVGVDISGGDDVTWNREIFSALAKEYLGSPTPLGATNLMEACLRHPHELVRTASAAAYHDRSSEPERIIALLHQGTFSSDLLTRQLAATALAQAEPNNARLRDLTRSARGAAKASGAADTSLLVHGTWALGATWWQPGGDFHSYFLKQVRSDLYSERDRFSWSGGYSDAARELGSDDLLRWVSSHDEQGLDLITHSHGGSVAMLANKKGLRIGELVLLSCPVHIPKYQPDFSQTRRLVSIRVHLDLVILADRGGQRFKHASIEENILPIWFDHSATHNPDIWKNSTYRIPEML